MSLGAGVVTTLLTLAPTRGLRHGLPRAVAEHDSSQANATLRKHPSQRRTELRELPAQDERDHANRAVEPVAAGMPSRSQGPRTTLIRGAEVPSVDGPSQHVLQGPVRDTGSVGTAGIARGRRNVCGRLLRRCAYIQD
jgi:hypothetical protein